MGVSPGLSSLVGGNRNKNHSHSSKLGGEILFERKEVQDEWRAAFLQQMDDDFPGCFRVAEFDGRLNMTLTTIYLNVWLW